MVPYWKKTASNTFENTDWLRGRPFNSWGGGGVILKKNFLQALVGRKKIACSTKEREKKFLPC